MKIQKRIVASQLEDNCKEEVDDRRNPDSPAGISDDLLVVQANDNDGGDERR